MPPLAWPGVCSSASICVYVVVYVCVRATDRESVCVNVCDRENECLCVCVYMYVC